MGNEHVLAASEATRATIVPALDADAQFRARLEHSLSVGYRLAAVILGSPADAEDATQDALERAWRSRNSLRDPERFDAWFQRIVVNACRDRVRRLRYGPTFVPILDHDQPAGNAGANAADQFGPTAERESLRQALQLLNLDQRIVIVLRFYLDLEIDEIARRVGTRPGTVKSRLHRGLKQLRIAWEGEQ